MGLLLLELLRAPGISPKRIAKKVICEGEEHLQTALAQGKGVLLLSGHLGNWELAAAALVARGYQVDVITKVMKLAPGEQFRRLLREKNRLGEIPRRNSIRQIFRALKANHVVVVALDQNMTADEGVFVDFFGQPASLDIPPYY